MNIAVCRKISLICVVFLCVASCKDKPWNNPYPKNGHANTLYSSFAEQPKTLDPARSFSMDEAVFIYQIYEPVLQYHYLKRPFVLEPTTLTSMPVVTHLDKSFKPLKKNAPKTQIAYTQYDITLKPGIYYQPHPAFSQDKQGKYLYLNLPEKRLKKIRNMGDFPNTGTRELTAEDYIYEIKRLAKPSLASPIFGIMAKHILGLSELSRALEQAEAKAAKGSKHQGYMDLRQFECQGAQVIDRYHFRILLKGTYPQFIDWLSMPFFAPIPWEADQFYSQAHMREHNLSFDWHPVGTGPYMLTVNNPNQRMVLRRNPNYHPDFYPNAGEPGDAEKGLLKDAGKPLPLTEKVVFTLEKESMPRWHKFLQGYYDASTLTSDSFDQAIQIDEKGNPQLTPALKAKNLRIETSVGHTTYYTGFNMLDPVIGGYSERAKKLRRAISLIIDSQEYIQIFYSGRGIVAKGPLPPGVFGHNAQSGEEASKSGLPRKDEIKGESAREISVDSSANADAERAFNAVDRFSRQSQANALLAEAGYPNGIDPKTGKPLLLYYDTTAAAGPDSKARFDWLRKQLAKIHIQLQIRATQYNRFQQKLQTGNLQLFFMGWVADYPDPENFLMLLYGPNGTVKHGGPNHTNYNNPAFDALFDQMKNTPNGPKRLAIIKKMLQLLQEDTPAAWGFHPMNLALSHAWRQTTKPDDIIRNNLKYIRVDPHLRAQQQTAWNKPILWPLLLFPILLLLIILPVIRKRSSVD